MGTLLGGTITNGVLSGGSYAMQSGDVDAVLAGAARLGKSGTGAVILSGANSYSGGTLLEAARLVFARDKPPKIAHAIMISRWVV